MHSYVDQSSTAGAITLIARHGKIIHIDVYGKADIEAGAPMQANSLFRMYSRTKPVTSMALLMLYEEGKFQLYRADARKGLYVSYEPASRWLK